MSEINNITNHTEYRRDFYEAVNRKWLDDPANSIPPEYSRWGGFLQLHDQGLKNQIELAKDLCHLLESDPEQLSASQKKIAATWDASMRRFRSWDENTATYDPIMKELTYLAESLPKFSIEGIADYLYYTHVNGISNILNFDKESDFKNTENVVLDLNSTGTSLPTRDYYLDEKFANKREGFLTHLNRVRELLVKTGADIPESFADDVVSFETDIARF